MNDAVDKHLDKFTPSTWRDSKDKGRSYSRSKAKCSDGLLLFSHFPLCGLRGNDFFCEVDEDYIQDDVNLCGLSSQVPYYEYTLDLILDVESSHSDMFTEEQNELVKLAAVMLYGLVHVRYILTSKGMSSMVNIAANFPVFSLLSIHFGMSRSQSSTPQSFGLQDPQALTR
ncbi:hypothetical protein V6N11_012428 [Hibiscus sabdariffa]|uniref:Casein kinase II subunit beta n=1 Tax=Hibiscus sabdariffa TaxID=183260 RepID=A0ABR2QBH3_9ROSI